MRMNDNDHNDSDGFVTAKSHRSNKKKQKNDETKQHKPHRNMSSSTPSSSTRFAGNKWAKPSATPAVSVGTSGTPVTTAAATAAAAVATTVNASTSPFIQHQQLPQPQPPEESKPSVSLTMSSLFGITTHHNDNMEIGNNTRTADHTTHTTTGITTKEFWPGHSLLATSSLASLMEDYGAYDPNWMNVEPTDMDHVNDDNIVTESESRNGTFRSSTSSIPDAFLLSNQDHRLNHNITMDETNALVGVDSPLDDFDNEQYQRQQLQHQQNQQQQEPQHEEEEEHETVPTDGINRLQLHGHAPIHVELVSFGYRYGIPSEIRYYSTGNCYTQPLLPFDTRTALVPVPVYLSHIDGKAGVIKNTMLRWRPAPAMGVADSHRQRPTKQKSTDDNDHNTTTTGTTTTGSSSNSNSKNCMNVREYVNGRVIPAVADAIVQAIDIGQHGYVSPITISIYIGSENGKHRSVVTAELSAVALRKILRTNTDNRFQCPVSVGCRHRDICLSSSSSHNKSTTAKKQKAFEDHDD